MNNHGFTTLEIVIMLAVITLISATAIPTYRYVLDWSSAKKARADLESLNTALYFYKATHEDLSSLKPENAKNILKELSSGDKPLLSIDHINCDQLIIEGSGKFFRFTEYKGEKAILAQDIPLKASNAWQFGSWPQSNGEGGDPLKQANILLEHSKEESMKLSKDTMETITDLIFTR